MNGKHNCDYTKDQTNFVNMLYNSKHNNIRQYLYSKLLRDMRFYYAILREIMGKPVNLTTN